MLVGDEGGLERGGIFTGQEGRGLPEDSETTISSRAPRTLCFVLVGPELPGMSLMFIFFRKRHLKQRIIWPKFQAEDFIISTQISHYLIPQ